MRADALKETDLEGLPALGVLAAWRVRVGSRLLEKELEALAKMDPPEGARERTWQTILRELAKEKRPA